MNDGQITLDKLNLGQGAEDRELFVHKMYK